MARLQFSLRQMVIATAVASLLLAIFVQSPAGFIVFFFYPAVAVCTFYWFTKVPYRVRLPVEIATAILLHALSAFLFQDPGYLYDAERADEVVRLASTLAGSVESPREKADYRRIASKYSGRSAAYRWKAIRNGQIDHWKAVLSGVAQQPYYSTVIRNEDYITYFGVLETRDRLEAELKRIQERAATGGPN